MSKSANRLLSHLTNSSIESAPDRGSIFGHRPIRRQASNAVYIYRHPISIGTSSSEENWSRSLTKELENVTGNKLRPVGSIIRRSSSSRRQCKTPSDLPSNPPSPPLDPTLKQQPLSANSSLAYQTKFRASVPAISIDRNENQQEGQEDVTFMDNKSTTAATADELMQMLMEDDGTDRPIIFTVFEAANIDGVKHLSSKSRCTRLGFFEIYLLTQNCRPKLII
uniref:SH2 domain-containing protein n=1 Tax=Meloidogyne hapla TaxID=6305 RepID=A0A1I8BZ26_MELHA